jgi:hypothetical protein
MVDAVGWEAFYWFTIACGIPGLVLLARFVPPAARDLPAEYEVQPATVTLRPAHEVAGTGFAIGGATLVTTTIAAVLLAALKAARANHTSLDFIGALGAVLHPATVGDWIQLAGIVVIALLAGLIGAAAAATRPSRPQAV